MKVIIFDTGTGGELFAEYYKKAHPDIRVEVAIDRKNSPYGDKTEQDIFLLTEKVIKRYIGRGDIIVLACNTATAAAIDKLRKKYPEQVFIGFEPMIKTASKLTKTGKVMVLATNATKKSKRYKELKSRFSDLRIIEPSCDSWAKLIDNNTINQDTIKNSIQGKLDDIDVIILACTHYVGIADEIKRIAGPGIKVINPFKAVEEYIHNRHYKK